MQRRATVALAAGGGGCLLILLASCAGVALVRLGAARPFGAKVYARPEFERAVSGLPAREVRDILGPPDVTDQGGVVWSYRGRTRDPATGAVDAEAHLFLADGRVGRVSYRAAGR